MLAAVLVLVACSTPEPPKEAKPEKPTCDVDAKTLAGSAWLHLKPQPVGPDKPDPMARLRFRDDAGKLKADYTAGSAGDVYAYDCGVNGGIVTCVESDPHAEAFCKAYAAASADGTCDPVQVAAATGVPQAAFDAVAEAVNKELKKLKPAEREVHKKVDNSPNTKIRGKFLVAVDKGTCRLTLQDKYQTLVDGKLHEYENVLGTAKFVRAETDYIWESCRDVDSAWAPAPDDDEKHAAVQAPGTIKFAAILQKDQKGGAGCTYTADVYKDWVKTQEDAPAGEDAKYGPRWDVSIPFSESGRHTVYFDRYKTCDGKEERVGITCALVRIE